MPRGGASVPVQTPPGSVGSPALTTLSPVSATSPDGSPSLSRSLISDSNCDSAGSDSGDSISDDLDVDLRMRNESTRSSIRDAIRQIRQEITRENIFSVSEMPVHTMMSTHSYETKGPITLRRVVPVRHICILGAALATVNSAFMYELALELHRLVGMSPLVVICGMCAAMTTGIGAYMLALRCLSGEIGRWARTHQSVMGCQFVLLGCINVKLQGVATAFEGQCRPRMVAGTAENIESVSFRVGPAMASAWTALLFVMFLCCPMRRAQTSRHKWAFVALVLGQVSFGLLFPLMLADDSHEMRNGYAIGDFAKCFQTLPIMMAEVQHFLKQGDGAGCRSLIWLPIFRQAFHVVAFSYFGPPDWRHMTLVTSHLLCILAINLATNGGPEMNSTSPMYLRTSSLDSKCPSLHQVRAFLRTWRGINLTFAANGVFTIVVYSVQRASGIRAIEEVPVIGFQVIHTAGPFRAIFALSCLSIILSLWNVFGDVFVGDGPCQHWSFFRQPDRHFRVLTVCKVAMLLVKLLFLISLDLKHKSSTTVIWQMAFQFTSITATSMLSCYSLFSLYDVALHIPSFGRWFRAPRTLWVTCLAGLVVLQCIVFVVMASRPLAIAWPMQPELPQRISWAALIIGHACPWYCLCNEAALCISSQAHHPKIFAALESPRGVFALVALVAASFPFEVLISSLEWAVFCPEQRPTRRLAYVEFDNLSCKFGFVVVVVGLSMQGFAAYWAVGIGEYRRPPPPPDPPPADDGDGDAHGQLSEGATTPN